MTYFISCSSCKIQIFSYYKQCVLHLVFTDKATKIIPSELFCLFIFFFLFCCLKNNASGWTESHFLCHNKTLSELGFNYVFWDFFPCFRGPLIFTFPLHFSSVFPDFWLPFIKWEVQKELNDVKGIEAALYRYWLAHFQNSGCVFKVRENFTLKEISSPQLLFLLILCITLLTCF